MSLRLLSDEPLEVAPELVGLLLASPLRRAVAFALDLAIVVVPSVAVAVAVAAAALALKQPRSLAALRTLIFDESTATAFESHAAMLELAPLLVQLDADGVPVEVLAAVRTGELDRAADELGKHKLIVAMSLSEGTKTAAPEGAVRFPFERLIPEQVRFVTLYGVAALYFGILTRGRRGATPGKRMVGIRVARLDGERLSLVESLERFAGYLHVPGSLGLSLIYLWRDPNRRLPHDRVANTAVLRVLRPATRARS
ncbi:MAG: RDD family protein [Acidobacteriia bacterium]|nr:RDD family protein [Terriglobia bacterium]